MAVAQELPLLGYSVIATLPEIEIPAQELHDLLTPLGWSHTVPELEDRTAVQLTVKAWLRDLATGERGSRRGDEGIGESGKKDKVVLREISRSNSQVGTFALVKESLNREGLDLTYLIDLQFLFDTSSGTLRLHRAGKASGGGPSDEELQARLDVQWHRYYRQARQTSAVLGRMYTEILSTMQAIALRSDGGVYFVPAMTAEKLLALQVLLETTLPSAARTTTRGTLLCIPQWGDLATRDEIARAAHIALLAELRALRTKLQEIIERARQGSTIRKKWMLARILTYRRQREKIQLYTDLVGMQQNDLELDLRLLRAQAHALFDPAWLERSERELLEEASNEGAGEDESEEDGLLLSQEVSK